MATALLGYAFFIDMSTQIWWDLDKLYWYNLNAFSVHPLRRSIYILGISSIKSAHNSVNYTAEKPFDSFVLSGSGGPIHIFPSFHRREELETLLTLLYEKRPDAFTDSQVTEFMNGGYTKWWRYR